MPEGSLFSTIAGQTLFWKAPQSTLRLEDGSTVCPGFVQEAK